jgi:hypothetical protein
MPSKLTRMQRKNFEAQGCCREKILVAEVDMMQQCPAKSRYSQVAAHVGCQSGEKCPVVFAQLGCGQAASSER